jgi:hypothetical protein
MTTGTVARIKAAASLLAAIALIAGSAALAQAGGGAGTSPGDGIPLFQCYVIEEGRDSPYVLELSDQFGTREHVRVGKARLLCTPVTATVESGPPLTEVNTGDPSFPHLSCYGLPPRRHDGGPDGRVLITDPFGARTVELDRPRLLCAGATKELVPTPPSRPPYHHR